MHTHISTCVHICVHTTYIHIWMKKIQKVPMAVDADDRCHFFLNLTLWTSLSSHYRGREWGFTKTDLSGSQVMTLDWDPKTGIITLSPTQPLVIFSGGEPPSPGHPLALATTFLGLCAQGSLGASSVPHPHISAFAQDQLSSWDRIWLQRVCSWELLTPELSPQGEGRGRPASEGFTPHHTTLCPWMPRADASVEMESHLVTTWVGDGRGRQGLNLAMRKPPELAMLLCELTAT